MSSTLLCTMHNMRVNVSLPEKLVERIDVERGDVSRSRFVRRALEAALAESVGGASRVSVSPRASANFGAVAEQPTAGYEKRMTQRQYVKPFRPQPKS